MMGHKGNKVTYPEFQALSKDEQRESILRTAYNCIDGAPVSLARRIEIYFDETEETQRRRNHCQCGVVAWLHFDGSENYVPADAVLSHPYKPQE